MQNVVSKSIAAAGSSKLEMLFYLVVLLHCLSMHFKFNVRFIHVAGNHIVGQVIGGISRGDMYEGITKRENMLSFLPLEKSFLDRYPALGKWIEG